MTHSGRGDGEKKSGGSGFSSASPGQLQIVDQSGTLTNGQSLPISGIRSRFSGSRPTRSEDYPQARQTDPASGCPSKAVKSPHLRNKSQQPPESRNKDLPPRRSFVSIRHPPRAPTLTSHRLQSVGQFDRGGLPTRKQTQKLSSSASGAQAYPAGEADLGRTPPSLPTHGATVESIPTIVSPPDRFPISTLSQSPPSLRRPSANWAERPRSVAISSRASFRAGPAKTSSTGHSYGHQAPAGGSTGVGLLTSRPSSLTAGGPSASLPNPSVRKIRLGIEMEILLAAKSEEYARPMVDDFVKRFAQHYNSQVSKVHPGMVEYFMSDKEENNYRKWSVVEEATICTQDSPWGVEMVTPILDVSTDPLWREHVEVAWECLLQKYHVTSHGSCGTHVHVSLVPNYNLRDIQRIAASAIYFEAAIEALVPADRRQNVWVQSNWRHSPLLMRKGRSRLESIAEIERATTKDRVISLMQEDGETSFTWNFSHLSKGGLKQTIEFRKPPASVTSSEALSWAELTMTFVQAAVQHGRLGHLQKFAANTDGLLAFLLQVNVAGVNEPQRLQRIWAGQPLDAAWEP